MFAIFFKGNLYQPHTPIKPEQNITWNIELDHINVLNKLNCHTLALRLNYNTRRINHTNKRIFE